MQSLYSSDPIHIHDYPEADSAIRRTRQKCYQLRSVGDHFRGSHPYSTTYTGSRGPALHGSSTSRLKIAAPGTTNVCVGFLLASKKCHKLAVKHLYARPFHLRCSAQGANAFLDDHSRSHNQRRVHALKHLELYYYLPGPDDIIPTDDKGWRGLLACIRHEHPGVVELVSLHVNDMFWELTDWSLGAEAVLEQQNKLIDERSLRMNDAKTLNFLGQVAKLAARKYRASEKYGGQLGGIDFELHVEGDEEGIKKRFVHELQGLMTIRMYQRPLVSAGRASKAKRSRHSSTLRLH